MTITRAQIVRLALLCAIAISCTASIDPSSEFTYDAAKENESYMSADGGADARVPRAEDSSRPRIDASHEVGDAALLDSNVSDAVVPLPPLGLSVTNLSDGETLDYPLARIAGTIESSASSVSVHANANPAITWPVQHGEFKALVRLSPGANIVQFIADGKGASIVLHYQPQTNPHLVRFVYVKTADGDGTFQAPSGEPSSAASALKRIGLAAEMLQAFTAESVKRDGGKRRTFRLQRDGSGKPDVLLHTTSLTTAQALGDNVDLWSPLNEELSFQPGAEKTIHVAVLGFTRYDPSSQKVRGHTAVGGGRLALFGSAALHTWPETLEQVYERTQDTTVIDGTKFFDDSAGRQRAWANYATGIGATMHELGHCLGPYHPNVEYAATAIMHRGMDHILRWFALSEPPSATSTGIAQITPDQLPGWHAGNAALLLYQRYLDGVAVEYGSNEPPTFHSDATTLRVLSKNGLRAALVVINGEVREYRHFATTPSSSLDLSLQTLRAKYGTGVRFEVSAIDAWGNRRNSDPINL